MGLFDLFRKSDPIEKLRREYAAKTQAALDKQRGGDVLAAGQLTAQAEEISKKITELEAQQDAPS